MPNSTSERHAPVDLKALIREEALKEGFSVVGFARAAAVPDAAEGLNAYLSAGHHGSMHWMEKNPERRAAADRLWEEAKIVVTLGLNYAPDEDPLAALTRKNRGTISVYAQGDDYHDVIKRKLKRVATWLTKHHGGEVKVFVDTAPVMEKPVAQMSGLGWQGKHTNLVSREFGSWLFLGSIFTTLELPPDDAGEDLCGSCQACLDICPTKAFPAPHQIDARRCISYLTIEHKGHIAEEFRGAIGNRIYGCDDCLAVCPWNKFAQSARENAFIPRETLRSPLLAELAKLDDMGFRSLFSKSPVKRIGRDRFVRNVLIAIGNSGDSALTAIARPLTDDPSPLVRAMAVWALAKLLPSGEFRALAQACAAQEIGRAHV